MHIALVLQHRVIAAIQHWFGGGASGRSVGAECVPASRHRHAPMGPCVTTRAPAAPARQVSRPLRVLRVVESGQGRSNSGRMVISGRMADVCAELDRLVAREAALQ